jgi:hypothetical protein
MRPVSPVPGLLVALSLLASTAAVHAECTWVLWSHNDFRVEGVPEVTQDRWVVQDSWTLAGKRRGSELPQRGDVLPLAVSDISPLTDVDVLFRASNPAASAHNSWHRGWRWISRRSARARSDG